MTNTKHPQSGEIYPKHYSAQQVQDLERALKVKRDFETVYEYLTSQIFTIEDQNKHSDKLRTAEKGIKTLSGLITELKNK